MPVKLLSLKRIIKTKFQTLSLVLKLHGKYIVKEPTLIFLKPIHPHSVYSFDSLQLNLLTYTTCQFII